MRLPLTVPIDRQPLLTRLLCRSDIAVLTLRADGRLGVERRDGTLSEAEVESGTTVYSSLVILRMRVDDRVESLVLPRAATGNAAHRRLRVWLKWRTPTNGVSAAG